MLFFGVKPIFLHIEFNDFVIRKYAFSSKLIFLSPEQVFSMRTKITENSDLRERATVKSDTLQGCDDVMG